MKALGILVAMSACVAALALSSSPRAQADGGKCGDKGVVCPLHDWMEKEMETAVDKSDMKALAAAFEKLAGYAPDPKWNEGENSWAKLSQDGAERAKAGDENGAKAQCKSCHKAWRNKYKEAFRSKALPK